MSGDSTTSQSYSDEISRPRLFRPAKRLQWVHLFPSDLPVLLRRGDPSFGFGCFHFLPTDEPAFSAHCEDNIWPPPVRSHSGNKQRFGEAAADLREQVGDSLPPSFFLLPLEIRQQIYRLILEPMFKVRSRDLPHDSVTGARFVVRDADYRTVANGVRTEVDYGLSVQGRPSERNVRMPRDSARVPRRRKQLPRQVDVFQAWRRVYEYCGGTPSADVMSYALAGVDVVAGARRANVTVPKRLLGLNRSGWACSEEEAKALDMVPGLDELEDKVWDTESDTSDSEDGHGQQMDSEDEETGVAMMDVDDIGVSQLVLEETTHGKNNMHLDKQDEVFVATQTTGTADTADMFPLALAGRPFLDIWIDIFTNHQTYETVHPMSRVSRQFTKELGGVLWHNATVEFEEVHTFFLFFKERPAVIPLVRHVVLNLRATYDGGAWDETTPLLKAICDFISTRMDLSFLTVRPHTAMFDWGWRETAEFRKGGYGGFRSLKQWPMLHDLTIEWARIFRHVKARGFNLCMAHWRIPESRTPGRRTRMRGRTESTKDIKRRLLALWMPNCLR